MNPRYIYRSEQYNCQMNKLMFQAGVKGMSERSELIPCIYRIARNFRGLKFSRFSRINDEPRKFYPPKFYLRLTYVARERNPRKLNREKFGQGSSAKILVLENF